MPSIEGLPLWISVSILLFYIIIKDGSSLWGFLTGNNVKNATIKNLHIKELKLTNKHTNFVQ